MCKFLLEVVSKALLGLIIGWFFIILFNSKTNFSDILFFITVTPSLGLFSLCVIFTQSYPKQIIKFEKQQHEDQLTFAREIENAGS